MNILILGSGGREHAFAWKIAQSPHCAELYVAPGNAGTAQVATNLPVGFNDFEGIAKAIVDLQIKLVIVGPEEPLVNGVVDYLKAQPALERVKIVGPDRLLSLIHIYARLLRVPKSLLSPGWLAHSRRGCTVWRRSDPCRPRRPDD